MPGGRDGTRQQALPKATKFSSVAEDHPSDDVLGKLFGAFYKFDWILTLGPGTNLPYCCFSEVSKPCMLSAGSQSILYNVAYAESCTAPRLFLCFLLAA